MKQLASLRRFAKDDEGSSTIEFLIWLPLLTVWLLFSSALFIAWDNRANVAKAAYTISDLISRRETVDAAFLSQIEDLNDRLVERTGDGNKMRVTSVIFDGGEYIDGEYVGGEFQVQWSCPTGGLEALQDADLPMDIIPNMAPLDTVILTETYVPYRPITSIGGLQPFDWRNVLISRPRIVREIALDGGCVPGA